jgi:hypothetical protein
MELDDFWRGSTDKGGNLSHFLGWRLTFDISVSIINNKKGEKFLDYDFRGLFSLPPSHFSVRDLKLTLNRD